MFLFDIDGTLIWSGGAGSAALERAFEELFGLRAAMAGVSCDGMTDPLIARVVLGPHGLDSPANIQRVLERYAVHLDAALSESNGFSLLPGARECLDHLSARGLHLGLATGNLQACARAKLERGGLWGYFGFGGFGSDAEERADLVRVAIARGRAQVGDPRADAVVLGDTPRDVQAARAAGALAVGVAAANFDRAALEAAGADLVLDSLERPEEWLPRVEALRSPAASR